MIDDHHSSDVRRELMGVISRDEGSDGETGENIGAFDPGVLEELMNFGDSLRAGYARAGIAPGATRGIVRADTREPGDIGLDKGPIEGESGACDEDRGAAFAGAVEMDAITADVDQLARGWRGLRGGSGQERDREQEWPHRRAAMGSMRLAPQDSTGRLVP